MRSSAGIGPSEAQAALERSLDFVCCTKADVCSSLRRCVFKGKRDHEEKVDLFFPKVTILKIKQRSNMCVLNRSLGLQCGDFKGKGSRKSSDIFITGTRPVKRRWSAPWWQHLG